MCRSLSWRLLCVEDGLVDVGGDDVNVGKGG
jgi:hypothetical protein